MTIENPSIIDAIGMNEKTGHVCLSIFNHLPWSEHSLRLLQDKINRYLGFIEHGEIEEAYPQAIGHPIAIDVYCKFEPTEQALRFFQLAQTVAEEYGAKFGFEHYPKS
ncbi:DUF6572 domain-containing protein [Variovorax sp. DAIF25]|jgi:hypothetical protein|uniref:DUF6572 domain-containing protein n=1 Tax=Variovorax sp. DAIF25 TaxID=3080983 RepID=UPI003D6AE5F3